MYIELDEGKSSTIKALDTDINQGLLIVTFLNGQRYLYKKVDFNTFADLFQALMLDSSIGKFFCSRIKFEFEFEKLEDEVA